MRHVYLAVDAHHPGYCSGIVLPPVTLLFPPLFVDDVLGFDVAPAPFLAASVTVEEDGLEDVG